MVATANASPISPALILLRNTDSGSAKVRGTGTVESGDLYEVKATESRKVQSVEVRVGDHVEIVHHRLQFYQPVAVAVYGIRTACALHGRNTQITGEQRRKKPRKEQIWRWQRRRIR